MGGCPGCGGLWRAPTLRVRGELGWPPSLPSQGNEEDRDHVGRSNAWDQPLKAPAPGVCRPDRAHSQLEGRSARRLPGRPGAGGAVGPGRGPRRAFLSSQVQSQVLLHPALPARPDPTLASGLGPPASAPKLSLSSGLSH